MDGELDPLDVRRHHAIALLELEAERLQRESEDKIREAKALAARAEAARQGVQALREAQARERQR